MKYYQFILLYLLSLLAYSCSDGISNMGSGIQPTTDQIKIGTDTFHVSTENVFVDYINSRPDSFLLGNFYDSKFGSTQAEILAQLNCPEGFKFPPNSQPDSAVVIMNYKTWFGYATSPMSINLYEMTKNTFKYSDLYPSNIDAAVYTDLSKPLGSKIFTAKEPVNTRKDTTAIRFKLSNSFVQRFFDDNHYSSTSKFLDFFKGIYLTTNFGASTLLNIQRIALLYHYHYTYTTKNISGGDSIVRVNSYLIFPANQEVRQVNRIQHNDRAAVVQNRDSVNYLSSPANIYTKVSVPLKRIQQRLKGDISGKALSINSAVIKVEITEMQLDTESEHPIPQYLLLIKESSKERFFKDRELPSDTCAIKGDFSYKQVGTSGVYKYYYSFNLASLIVKELKNAAAKGESPKDKLELLLLPVKIATTTSSSGVTSYTSVKEDYQMSGITIRSGKEINPNSGNKVTMPMHLDVVYSGF